MRQARQDRVWGKPGKAEATYILGLIGTSVLAQYAAVKDCWQASPVTGPRRDIGTITPGNFTKLKYDVAIAESRNRDNKRHQPKLSAMRLRSSIAKSEDKLKRRLEKRWREYFLTKQSRPILSLVHESDIRTTTPDSFTAEEMQS
jgi:hypothetical protein